VAASPARRSRSHNRSRWRACVRAAYDMLFSSRTERDRIRIGCVLDPAQYHQPLADLTHSVDKIRLGAYDVRRARRDATSWAYWRKIAAHAGPRMSRDQSIRRLAYEDTAHRTHESQRLQRPSRASADRWPRLTHRHRHDNLHRFRRINEHLGYWWGRRADQTAARLAAVPSGTPRWHARGG